MAFSENKPPANFTPTLGVYSGVQPMRYWVQEILPLTFDDSLSYMELLNKVVAKLNEIIESVNEGEFGGVKTLKLWVGYAGVDERDNLRLAPLLAPDAITETRRDTRAVQFPNALFKDEEMTELFCYLDSGELYDTYDDAKEAALNYQEEFRKYDRVVINEKIDDDEQDYHIDVDMDVLSKYYLDEDDYEVDYWLITASNYSNTAIRLVDWGGGVT